MNVFALMTLCVLQLSRLQADPGLTVDRPPQESVQDPGVEAITAEQGLAIQSEVKNPEPQTEPDKPTPKLNAKEQVGELYQEIKIFVTTRGTQFLMDVAAAVATFYFGRMLARMATKIVSEVMEKLGTEPILIKFGANLLYCALLGVIGIASLKMVGVDMTSVTAMIATAGFAIGLALQGSLGNFAAGIMLIIFKPFGVGDEIEASGQTGSVEEVNIFDTILRTNGNVKIIIPNGQITAGTIKNFTAQRIRLIELRVGCGYCDDLKAVKAFLERVLNEDRRVVKTPSPTVAVAELADFSVIFSVKCWVGTKEFGDLRSALLERVKLGFDEEGFTFPYPSRDVYVHQSNAGAAKAA